MFAVIVPETFQFQNGTIMRVQNGVETTFSVIFQFQNGTIMRIKLTSFRCTTHAISIPKWYDYEDGFNVVLNGFFVFQFQNGTIMSFLSFLHFQSQRDFNSKMVRL